MGLQTILTWKTSLINESKKLIGPFLIDLKNRFREIAGDDQLIDKDEFRNGLGISNNDISDRLFDIFDQDGSGSIDYDEFMGGIRSMVEGTDKDKIKFAFQLHDLDNNGYIDRDELKALIQQSFFENQVDYDEFQLDLLVDEFFDRADKDMSGTIDYNEFLDIANDYPGFMEGFAVNPVHWLVPDRYEDKQSDLVKKKDRLFRSNIQVQDIGLFQWLLIPRLIFLYNVLMNRRKNRAYVGLQSIRLLPSKVLEITISSPEAFTFTPGDYLYINCKEISSTEWYPFNIIKETEVGDLILHVKSNNFWAERLYDSILETVGQDTTLNWSVRIDGPYGSSSLSILDTQHAIMVGAGHGISRMAPILQDIVMKVKEQPDDVRLKKVDLYWIIEDRSYFEWFTKMLKDIEVDGDIGFFSYHIFFLDRSPEDISRKMMYMSTNVNSNETNISMVDNLWNRSRFGMPEWGKELAQVCSDHQGLDSRVFYSGPIRFARSLKRECKSLGVDFNRGSF